MTEAHQIPLIVLGIGKVGRAFLALLEPTRAALTRRYGVNLLPVAVADTWGAVFNPDGLSPATLDAARAAKSDRKSLAGLPQSLGEINDLGLIEHAAAQGLARAIVIDSTAAEADAISPALHRALDLGWGVVFANKRPLAAPWSAAQGFFEHPRVRFEATVSAGVPVIGTLRYLVDTGDEIRRLDGALSGTLGFICSRLEAGDLFSTSVIDAQARGYTEPDPREDLKGIDVSRKALILGRLAGWPLEKEALRVEPLYPDHMVGLTLDEFMRRLPELDSDYAAYMGALAGVPRYLAEITPEGGVVSLRMVGEQLAARLRGTLNQLSITSRRYADVPLSLIGPGVGMENTAASVLQDCLSLVLALP